MSSLARRLTRAKRRERLSLRRDRASNSVVVNFGGDTRTLDLTPQAPPPSIESAFQGLEKSLAEVDAAGRAMGLSAKSLKKVKEAILAVGLEGLNQ
ncbi:hypothetical protein IYX23_09250 [Methylocystis sp. L43]|uniref:hypothetical protein n=1 Tax=unclassified Methylocystis TaxID=2625913 RepID=UPI0018C2F93C|nr:MULTISPECIES: hypothetical protein [unclassified Methylocystis]MBG0796803.1 hypothetical protein [Methylocystis sp. L43]MBG0797856.1 hypothetical protein [Methylocystis sp. L43]MBG0806090.1 hypothetical protein [Methylocystis sp. H15]